MQAIGTQDELVEARSVARAMIFLWVNWAAQARQSEVALERLLACWQSAFPQQRISVYRAPISATKPGRSGKRSGRGLRSKPVQSTC
jgi:hypothetical protein